MVTLEFEYKAYELTGKENIHITSRKQIPLAVAMATLKNNKPLVVEELKKSTAYSLRKRLQEKLKVNIDVQRVIVENKQAYLFTVHDDVFDITQ